MAENEERQEPQPAPETEPHGTDWKAESRKWEERSKANRAELEAVRSQLDELRGEQAKRSDAAERAAKAEAEVERMRAELERSALVSRVAESRGVPASLLHGDDEAELEASADALMAFARSASPAYPADSGSGGAAAPMSVESIESIRDPVARIRARAEHIDLYE